MNQNPEQNPEQTPEQEETLAERSARLEAEASNITTEETSGESDPLAPEPEPELYNEENPLDTGDTEADGHLVILRLQKELEEANDKMVRAVAETENIRRRSVKEREDSRKYAVSGFSKDILTVADNLRRALEAVPEEFASNEQLSGLIGGIEATERELLRAFEKNGITKLDSSEGVFDPNLHEVMFETPGTGQPAGTIIQTLEPGYMLHDRLLRPARVGVAKGDDSGAPPETPRIDTEA
jgi:molecular chaperone GrpE